MTVAQSTLILIDIQVGFDDASWGARNNPDAEARALELLAHWRAHGRPVIHVRHASAEPGSTLAASGPGFRFKPGFEPAPGEVELVKSENSAFIGTDLEQRLRSAGVTSVIVCGFTTPHCVSTTARMAANLGFQTFVAHDACATFASNLQTDWTEAHVANDPELSHRYALSHLHREFALVRPTHFFTAT